MRHPGNSLWPWRGRRFRAMPLTLPNIANPAVAVGQTPRSARDAPVPRPEQRDHPHVGVEASMAEFSDRILTAHYEAELRVHGQKRSFERQWPGINTRS